MHPRLASLAIGIAFLAAPFAASAASFADIQSQIAALLQQIQQLQQQLVALQSQPTASITSGIVPPPDDVCYEFRADMRRGMRGDDVRMLQKKLISQNLLPTDAATGYYGTQTEAAIQKMQAQEGIAASGTAQGNGWGMVGPRTRAWLSERCGTPLPQPPRPPVACTMEYAPVCGQVGAGSCEKKCEGNVCQGICTDGFKEKTYSNKCMLQADAASFLYMGECKRHPAECPVYQMPICPTGQHLASEIEKYDPLRCPPPPRCIGDGIKSTVSISSFHGPTTLKVDEQGTWRVHASDSQNGTLTYDIRWGDERLYAAAMSMARPDAPINQETTFTHAYQSPGTYTVSITVRNQSGASAKMTATVRVEGGLGCLSGGTTYPEGHTTTTVINPDGTAQGIADAHFVCRGGEWKIEGTWREGPISESCGVACDIIGKALSHEGDYLHAKMGTLGVLRTCKVGGGSDNITPLIIATETNIHAATSSRAQLIALRDAVLANPQDSKMIPQKLDSLVSGRITHSSLDVDAARRVLNEVRQKCGVGEPVSAANLSQVASVLQSIQKILESLKR